MKKNRLPFSAIMIEPTRNITPTHNDSRGDTSKHDITRDKNGRRTSTISTSEPHNTNKHLSSKKLIKSSTYQYSKKNYGQSRSSNRSFGEKSKYNKNTNENKIPPPADGVIRIIPLGGVEEIGKNMTAIEIDNDIIVIDAGMHFSNEDTPGVDYVIPNTTYLEEHKEKIRGLFITHGHLDHIGGVPLVLSRIGNPPVYSRQLSMLLMRKRQAEFPQLPAMKEIIVEKDEVITCGKIKIKFFGVTHTIPDSMGIIKKWLDSDPWRLQTRPGRWYRLPRRRKRIFYL
jgi:ribonuclease J